MDDIRLCYGDLASPDYRTAAARLAGSPYKPLVAAWQSAGLIVEETTDTNDDVSVQLSVGRNGEQVAVELSAVGPYAIIRDLTPGAHPVWVTTPTETKSALVRMIVEIVRQGGFALLSRHTALTRIPMQVEDDSTCTLYRALFTVSRVPPDEDTPVRSRTAP